MFAGFRELVVAGGTPGSPFSAKLLYPCEQPALVTAFGPYELEVSVDAPAAAGRFPLVVISHGSGGSPLLHRTLSVLLARSGYIVALPKHPGNSLGDNDQADSLVNLQNRPAHVVALLNTLAADALLAGRIAAEPVTIVGHSMGGYTALSVAGGQPWTRSGQPIAVLHDVRIGALVLLAPACGPFLASGALTALTAPMLVLTAEHDLLTPDGEIRAALAGVRHPNRVTIRTIPNAGHFSFLDPFPPSLRDPHFAPAADPSGFDRGRFHEWFPELVLKWIIERRQERALRQQT